ncbi:unnamed protein product [Cochlearia groenlandica]
MSLISSTLTHWFVNHPNISGFKWTEGETLGSTVLFVSATVSVYLSATFLVRSAVDSIPSLAPRFLKPITAIHSLILCFLSLIMAVGCTLSMIVSSSSSHAPLSSSPSRFLHAICFPSDVKPNGPLFFWAQVFYLSKILEFGDTILIVLGKSIQRLSFLHVYHHATVVVMCFLWLRTRQSMFPVALVTNSTVHVIMYGYYFLCAVGSKPKWKRLVTDCQIVQFVFSFGLSGWMLQEHWFGSGCSGIWGWCFNAAFNASLLALFFNFHSKNYLKMKTIEVGKKCD